MFKYTIKRILYFFPTLIAISFLAFGLSKCTPGDQAIPDEEPGNSKSSFYNYEKEYKNRAEILGLTGPTFYFELTSKAYYKNAIQATQLKLFEIPDSVGKASVKKIRKELNFLPILSKDKVITRKLNKILKFYNNTPTLEKYLKKEITDLQNSYQNIKEKATPNQLLIPTIHWYGIDNQYHNWFTKFMVGDFGTSIKTMRPVATEIKDAIFWTFSMMTLAIIVAYLTAIPLGCGFIYVVFIAYFLGGNDVGCLFYHT